MIKIWNPIQDLDKKVTTVNEMVRNLEYKFKNMDKNLNQETETLRRNQTETRKCKPIKLENTKECLMSRLSIRMSFKKTKSRQ